MTGIQLYVFRTLSWIVGKFGDIPQKSRGCCIVIAACALVLGGTLRAEDATSESESDGNAEETEELQQTEAVEGENPRDEKEAKAANEEDFSSLEDILNYEATDADYQSTENCLEKREIRDYDIISQRFIVVRMRDENEKYLIQLTRRCVGVTKGTTLRFDSRRSGTLRMCANDSIRGSMGNQWGPPCRIPGFEPVNAVQLEQLTRGLFSGRVE